MCPDSFSLGDLKSNSWPVRAKIAIAAIVIGVGVVCLFMKFMFRLWLYRLEKKQDDYLEQLDSHLQACMSHLEVRNYAQEGSERGGGQVQMKHKISNGIFLEGEGRGGGKG